MATLTEELYVYRSNRDLTHQPIGAFYANQQQKEDQGKMSTATEQLNGAVNAAKRAEARRLNMKEDFLLNNWLHGREYKRGESIEQILEHAKKELKIDGLNYNHIQFRLEAFKDTLPLPKPEPLTVVERIDRLERTVAILARSRIHGELEPNHLAWLDDFWRELGQP